MSATITLTTTAQHSLCLFSSSPPPPSAADEDVRAQQQQQQRPTAVPSLSSASSSPSTSIHSSTDTESSASSSSRPGSFADTWPMAVEALAQRLWDCGREALLSRRSSNSDCNSTSHESKLVFDETGEAADICLGGGQEDTSAGLCDGPYVRIDYSASPPPPPPPPTLLPPATDLMDQHPPLQQRVACGRPPLIHYRPRTNPFKTMMRTPATATLDKSRLSSAAATSRACRRAEEAKAATSPPTTPSSTPPLLLTLTTTSSVSTGAASNNSPPPSCTHCKRGNFLEFCFVSDRCSCRCHDVCPCNPCLDIKDHRRNVLGAHKQRVSTMLPSRPSKAARVWAGDGHPPQIQHRQPSLCTLTT
ncbi:hypothetical protein H4R27_000445 [Coemansia aciculifera]|nr:hypothetical protein H4R27_000445 [Coemansia aciculifera]